MRLHLLLLSVISWAGLAQAWTKCMLDCMGNAAVTAGCGQDYNATSCMCLNAQFTTLTRTCFYTACPTDIYPWYNLREAECGTLTADLTAPEFIPSNGNSTYDKQKAANSSAPAPATAPPSTTTSASSSTSSVAGVAATTSRAAADRAIVSVIGGWQSAASSVVGCTLGAIWLVL